MVVSNLVPESTRAAPRHVTLAVVFQVRDDALQALMAAGASLSRAVGRSRAATSSPGRRSRARSAATSPRRWMSASRASRAARDAERPRTEPAAVGARNRVPRSCARRPRLALPPDTAWHPVGALPPAAFDHGEIVEAGLDTTSRQALLHEHRVRAGAGRLHALGVTRPLRRRPRPRRLGHEPPARAAPARCSSEPERSASQGERAAGRRSSSASARGSWR